jgi:hypothetical protein
VGNIQNRFGVARDTYVTIISRVMESFANGFEPCFMIQSGDNYVPMDNAYLEMQIMSMPSKTERDVLAYDERLYKMNTYDCITTNYATLKKRHIFATTQAQSCDANVFFGSQAGVHADDILRNLPDIDATEKICTLSCDILCELAEKFSGYGKKYKFDRSKSQLFVKPAALNLWLQLQRSRPELSKVRIVTHGTSKKTFDLIAHDAFGFSLCNAGRVNGEVKGRGIYCSLDDTVSAQYSFDDPGTMLFSLLLTTADMTEQYGSWSTYALGTDFKNVVVVHESCLMLILGKLVVATQ